MNVLVIPSWCPGIYAPLRGTFFLEQSEALARLRPDWNVVFLSWDPDTAKLLTRHPRRLFHNLSLWRKLGTGQGVHLARLESGLYLLDVWTPVLRTNTHSSVLHCLQKHLAKGLDHLAAGGMTPDIIHAHASMPAGKAACDVYRQKRIPYVLTEHMRLRTWPGLCRADGTPLPEIHEAFANARKVLTVSRSLAADMHSYGLADDIAILPNGVNSDLFSANACPNHDGFSFLSIGWPSKEKGTDILLKAFAEVHAERPCTTLHIAGSSSEESDFRNLAVYLEIQDAVFWKGNVSRAEMPATIASCDAFVLPSRSETFGVAYVEALMAGKPVIATACGGPEDIVTPQNGFLVPVGDTGALATAMREVMDRDFLPAAIRADAVKRFSVQQTSLKLACMLEEILQ